jgi:gliding motility-associated-like protein
MSVKIFVKAILVTMLGVFAQQAKASHLFGGEFFYTFVSGTTYKFTLNLYADCSTANQPLLTNLLSANPQVRRFNGPTLVDSFGLTFQNSLDVTPVCPGVVTTCASLSGGTQQGVKRYTYEANKAITTTSANWRFLFTGNLNFSSNLTGRSPALTNILVPGGGGSVMMLEATLNNTVGTNSSPSYSTIPTPFYCINTASSYNQGAIDPDGDVLSFALVDGMQAPATVTTYVAGYSASNPISTSAGTFSFSTTTGQLSFNLNMVQASMVVNQVTETRAGVVVGTSMREMVIVGLNNCTNSPPGGVINTTSVGIIDSSVNIYICQSAPTLNFTILPVDINGDTINAAYSGLPGNSTMSITNNGTPTPTLTGNWTPVGGFVLGDYTFYITYTDNGCPLKSQQTIAYTIHVLPPPTITAAVVNATCANGLVGSVTATILSGTPSYTYKLGTISQPTNVFSNVAAGTYTLSMVDSKNCTASTLVTITAPPVPIVNSIAKTTASCAPGCDGTMTVTATMAGATLQYSKDNGATYQVGTSFSGLCVGTYTVVVKDFTSGCTASSIVNIVLPPLPSITSLSQTTASCTPGCDATISAITVTPAATYTFTLNGGSSNTAGSFSSVCLGTFTIVATDAASCSASSVVTIINPSGPIFSNVATATASCIPGCDGAITSFTCTSVNGGLSYKLNGGASTTTASFASLCVGTYTILATDASGCTKTTTTTIGVQPNPTINSTSTTLASCVPGCDGTVSISASAFGGSSLTYQVLGGGPASTSSTIGSLCVGNYTIQIVDAKNCTATSAIQIQKVADPTIPNFNFSNISCFGQVDGAVVMTALGTGSMAYTLQPGALTNSSGTYTGLAKGIYTLTATDSKGCSVSTVVAIIEPNVLQITGVIKMDKTCEDKDNGSITTLITGGTAPFGFQLLPNNSFSALNTFDGLKDGTYTVIVRDANNCNVSTSVIILPPVDPLRIATESSSVKCSGFSTDGWAEVTASQGTPPYTYLWNTDPAQVTPRIENLFAGTFIIAVTDSGGCTQKDTVYLVDPTYCCEEVFVANAFSPNLDLVNDDLAPRSGTNLTNYKFQVFDRWGNNVFSSTNINQRWDGSYNGKEGADLSVYFYVLSYRCLINNQDYIKKGDILLLK